MAATVTNYGSIITVEDATLANVMAVLAGKPADSIVAFFWDGTEYIAIIKNM